MSPPIDILAVAAERLNAAQETLHYAMATQRSPAAARAYWQALIAKCCALEDLFAARRVAAAIAREG